MALAYQWPWDIASGMTVGKVIVLAGSTFCGPWLLIQPAGDYVLEGMCHVPTSLPASFWKYVVPVLVRFFYDDAV